MSGSETGPPPTPNITKPDSRAVVSTPIATASRTAIITPKSPISLSVSRGIRTNPATTPSNQKTSKPLAASNIKDLTNSSPIALLKPRNIPKKIQINIGTLTGKVIHLTVMSTDTISTIKRKLQDEEGISYESQILIFREQELKNENAQLSSLGIQDNSTIQLLIHMTGGIPFVILGPGAPLRTKLPEAETDNIVLLLCKQDSEYFVVDIRLTDDYEMNSSQRLEHIQKSLKDGSLLDILGNVECVDIVDLSDLPNGVLRDQEDLKIASRPSTSGSTSSFLSFATQDSLDMAAEDNIYQLLCDAEWMLTNEAEELKASFKEQRPATAISLMRLPNGSRPMLVIPKSRPASAETISRKYLSSPFETDEYEEMIMKDEEKRSKVTKQVSFSSSKKGGAKLKSSGKITSKRSNEKHKRDAQQSSEKVDKIYGKDAATLKTLGPNTKTEAKSSLNRDIKRPTTSKKEKITDGNMKKSTCQMCKKKLGPAQTFKCKCTGIYCAQHRYSDRHSCAHDYKLDGKLAIEKENPSVKREKVIRL